MLRTSNSTSFCSYSVYSIKKNYRGQVVLHVVECTYRHAHDLKDLSSSTQSSSVGWKLHSKAELWEISPFLRPSQFLFILSIKENLKLFKIWELGSGAPC